VLAKYLIMPYLWPFFLISFWNEIFACVVFLFLFFSISYFYKVFD
jgi:hypothetical protein